MRDCAPDAVVIGAGHHGLVAANLLADAGWDVVVCEATPYVGGAVRSADGPAPGYVRDLFSAFYPLSAASPVLRSLGLEHHGLTWSHAPAVLAHVLPDDRCAVLWQDANRTADSLAAFDPADAAAWLDVVAGWEPIARDVLDAVLSPFPPVGPVGRLARQLGAGGLLRLARLALLPVRRFGDERFRGQGGPLLFAGNALHADLSPDGAGSALYGWLLCMLGHSFGFPVPVGGAGNLSAALAARARSRGVVIRTGAPVTSVRVVDDRATGVVLGSGEWLPARRAVLADVNAVTLYRDLVGHEHLPSGLVGDLRRFQWDPPTLKVDWALSRAIAWTAPEAAQAGTVHLAADMDDLTDYAADLAARRIPRTPFLLFGQMTTADTTRSPAGTESAWAYTHLPRGRRWTEPEIAAHVERVEDVLEQHAPGFRASVVGRRVQSPTALENENPNLVDGSISGGTSQLHQQLVFRPVPGLAGATTPIDGLYLASASAHPGGGVHGACGANAAHAALRRAAPTGRARRAVTQRLYRRIY